jgi:hypothetical protein
VSQSNSAADMTSEKQIDLMQSEILRLRQLCLKVMDERALATGGHVLSQGQSDEIKGALQSAWAELERKQSYLETAFDEIAGLKAQLAQVQSNAVDTPEMDALKTSLHDAWAEIERKQGYLETSVAATQALQAEIAALKR